MTVRRRILLAALALAVVAIVVALIWSAGAKDSEPKLEFTLAGYTNGPQAAIFVSEKCGLVTVRNLSKSAVTLSGYETLLECNMFQPFCNFSGLRANLAPGGSCTMLPAVSVTTKVGNPNEPIGSTTSRWRLKCTVERQTLSNRMRRAAQKLPVIGRHIDSPPGYTVYSDVFEQ